MIYIYRLLHEKNSLNYVSSKHLPTIWLLGQVICELSKFLILPFNIWYRIESKEKLLNPARSSRVASLWAEEVPHQMTLICHLLTENPAQHFWDKKERIYFWSKSHSFFYSLLKIEISTLFIYSGKYCCHIFEFLFMFGPHIHLLVTKPAQNSKLWQRYKLIFI